MSKWLLCSARSIRRLLLSGLRASGTFERVADSKWRSQRLLILCYHGVSLYDEHECYPELFVTKEFLRRRFEILKNKGYAVLPLGDAIHQLRRSILPPRSVALTFDDGFYNFLSVAVPILQEFGFPATNYVSSYYAIKQRPILGLTLKYLVWCARDRGVPPNLMAGQENVVDLRCLQQRNTVTENLLNCALELENDKAAQLDWMEMTAKQLGVDWNMIMKNRLFHLLSPDEIAETSNKGFDIQLHTHRHRTPRNKDEFFGEILENRRILERYSGRPAVHFCYPSGDFDAKFLPWLRELDVASATTGISSLARANDDPLLLPRYIDTMAQPEVIFESWLSGVAELTSPRFPSV